MQPAVFRMTKPQSFQRAASLKKKISANPRFRDVSLVSSPIRDSEGRPLWQVSFRDTAIKLTPEQVAANAARARCEIREIFS